MPTKYPHGRLPSSSGASSMRWRAKESRELEARGMTTTSRRRPGPGAPGDESRSPTRGLQGVVAGSARSTRQLFCAHRRAFSRCSRTWADAPFVRHLVPEADHRLGPIMFVPHRTETGRSEQEVPARPRVEPEPARGEHSEKVSAREEQGVPVDCPNPAYHPVGPRSDLVRRLPSRAAVAEQPPVGALGADVGAGATFIRAVVPFEEMRLDFRRGAEASQL